MPRIYEINGAFNAAVYRSQKGYLCLHTDDFVRELAVKNWAFSRETANAWIKVNQPDFLDKTEEDSQNRLWILRQMGRVH